MFNKGKTWQKKEGTQKSMVHFTSTGKAWGNTFPSSPVPDPLMSIICKMLLTEMPTEMPTDILGAVKANTPARDITDYQLHLFYVKNSSGSMYIVQCKSQVKISGQNLRSKSQVFPLISSVYCKHWSNQIRDKISEPVLGMSRNRLVNCLELCSGIELVISKG